VPRSKNEWNSTSTPQYAFMAWCSVKKKAQGLYLKLLFHIFVRAPSGLWDHNTYADSIVILVIKRVIALLNPLEKITS
jgi:hypothetical protein